MSRRAPLRIALAAAFGGLGAASVWSSQPETIDGVTLAAASGRLFAPLRQVCDALGIRLAAQDGDIYLDDRPLGQLDPLLPDGTRLLAVRRLADWDVTVRWNAETQEARLSRNDQEVTVRRGEKRVVIDKGAQELRAMQGDRTVLRTRVSTGRQGYRTPNGEFEAGPYKAEMHYSSLYNGAPMPWSVQIVGDIFVHGYSTVPNAPASHGCIRLPTTGANPARFFYEWVEVGTPVHIEGRWRS